MMTVEVDSETLDGSCLQESNVLLLFVFDVRGFKVKTR